MLWAIIIALLVIIDQLTKFLVMKCIPLGNAQTIINKFFYLSHYENTGVAWSMFQNRRLVIITLTIIVSIILCYFLYKMKNIFLKISLVFLLGGALGNLIDRILKGSVTDFLEFHFGSYVYPIFNMADIFGVLGVLMFFYYSFFLQDKTR